MGTNYYWHANVCEHCNRSDAPLHIGKSSYGWCFALHVDPFMQITSNFTQGIESLDAWCDYVKKNEGQIRDEYGTTLSLAELLKVITERNGLCRAINELSADEQKSNLGEYTDEGLLRHIIDGRHCVGHGSGTWDFIRGEFS